MYETIETLRTLETLWPFTILKCSSVKHFQVLIWFNIKKFMPALNDMYVCNMNILYVISTYYIFKHMCAYLSVNIRFVCLIYVHIYTYIEEEKKIQHLLNSFYMFLYHRKDVNIRVYEIQRNCSFFDEIYLFSLV